jgi:hypothetical protein
METMLEGWKIQDFHARIRRVVFHTGVLVRDTDSRRSAVEVTGDEVILLNLNERRHIDRTPSMRVGTASVEPAARRRINGARYFSAEYVTPLMTRVHDRNRGYERLSVRM